MEEATEYHRDTGPSRTQRLVFVAVLTTLFLALTIFNTVIIVDTLQKNSDNVSWAKNIAAMGQQLSTNNIFAAPVPDGSVAPNDQFRPLTLTRAPSKPAMMTIVTLAPWSETGGIYNRTDISDSSTGNGPNGSDTPTGTSGSGSVDKPGITLGNDRPALNNGGSSLNGPDGDDADLTGADADQPKRPGGSNQPDQVNGSLISINAVDGTDLNTIGDQGQNGLIGTNNLTVSREPTTKEPTGAIGTNNLSNNVNNVYNIYNIGSKGEGKNNASYSTGANGSTQGHGVVATVNQWGSGLSGNLTQLVNTTSLPKATTKNPTTTTKKPTTTPTKTTTTTKKPTTTTKKPTTTTKTTTTTKKPITTTKPTTTTKKPTTTTKKPTTTTKKPTTTTKRPTTTTRTTTTTKKPITTTTKPTTTTQSSKHHSSNTNPRSFTIHKHRLNNHGRKVTILCSQERTHKEM